MSRNCNTFMATPMCCCVQSRLKELCLPFKQAELFERREVSSCYECSGLRSNDCSANYASLGFYTRLIKIYSDFTGDSELSLSRYKPHQVPLRRSDWPHTSRTPLYNRRITIGFFLRHPLDLNCHPEKGGSTGVQNIGTHVTDIR